MACSVWCPFRPIPNMGLENTGRSEEGPKGREFPRHPQPKQARSRVLISSTIQIRPRSSLTWSKSMCNQVCLADPSSTPPSQACASSQGLLRLAHASNRRAGWPSHTRQAPTQCCLLGSINAFWRVPVFEGTPIRKPETHHALGVPLWALEIRFFNESSKL